MRETKTGHVVGRTYYSTYWREAYTVRAVRPDSVFGEAVTVYWHAQRRETTHCTPRGDDKELS